MEPGFIGAHLTDKMINLGHKVLVVDILKPQGGIPFVNKKSKFIKGDISKTSTLKKLNIGNQILYTTWQLSQLLNLHMMILNLIY